MLGPAGYIWLGVVFVVIVVAVMTVVTVVRRRRMIRAVIGRAPNRVLREAGFYLDLLDAFSRAGFPKPSHRSPRAHVEILRERRPDLAEAAAPLVDLFYEIRFGGRRLESESRRRAESDARNLLLIASRREAEVR
jgi:heme exporter protein D